MANDHNIVLWIENKAERDLHEELEELLNAKGIKLRHVFNVDKLAVELENIQANRIRGFIVDMMLDGSNNLSSFGKPEVEWDHDETDAGKTLLKYILKEEQSDYLDIPTMILSVRTDIDDDFIKKYKKTQLIIKRDMVNSNWLGDLKKWINSL